MYMYQETRHQDDKFTYSLSPSMCMPRGSLLGGLQVLCREACEGCVWHSSVGWWGTRTASLHRVHMMDADRSMA